MKRLIGKTMTSTVFALIVALLLCGCIGKRTNKDFKNELKNATDAFEDADMDIDLDALNESVETLKDLDLNTDIDIDLPSDPDDEDSDEPEGDKTVYSFTDVYRNGNEIRIVPNGGLNGSTVLYGGKDLDGFLDYVDSVVLEEGRTINRDLFYDILATMLVDKDLSSDTESIEKNMIMALAMANNFHDTDVRFTECILDANNASEYHYEVNAFGTEDTWIVDYGKRTVYMNDGATEYSSDMFRDDYLGLWLAATDEYYGINN